MKSRKQAENIWSPRSQKSMLRQLELEAAQEKCRNQIAFAEKRIAQEKETAERQTATVVDGNNFNIRQALNKTLADIEERERELAAFRKRETSLQAGINALALSPAQAAQRANQQGELAALAMERFTKDAAIDAALQKFRKALQERAALTAQMVELAGRLEFAATADFDAGRFAALLDSLPAELAAQSHDWVNAFFGQVSEKEFCTIGTKAAVLPETLACAGVFRRGESAYLSKAQIAKLPTDEASKPVPTPEEMEAGAKLKAEVLPGAARGADSIAVSGFPVR